MSYIYIYIERERERDAPAPPPAEHMEPTTIVSPLCFCRNTLKFKYFSFFFWLLVAVVCAAAHNSTAHAPTLISPHPACRCQYSPASILLLESSAIFAFSIMHFPSLYFWLSSNASTCSPNSKLGSTR